MESKEKGARLVDSTRKVPYGLQACPQPSHSDKKRFGTATGATGPVDILCYLPSQNGGMVPGASSMVPQPHAS